MRSLKILLSKLSRGAGLLSSALAVPDVIAISKTAIKIVVSVFI